MPLPNNCPLCLSEREHQSVVTSHVYGKDKEKSNAFFECESCEVIYQYPFLSEEEEHFFYVAEFENFMSTRSGEDGGWLKSEDHIAANEENRIRRMNYLSSFLTEPKEILEVGCSSGFMLYPLIKDGHSCTGIEPSGAFGNFLKKNNVESYSSIEELKNNSPRKRFDLVFHFFVLEHIRNPVEFLRELLGLLKPGGKIIFEIPNSSDPLYSIYDIPEFERFYWSVAHPWYFNKKSLSVLLKKINQPFDILLEQRYDLSNHLIWARDGKPGGMKRFTHIIGDRIDIEYKRMLVDSGYCDTLIGVVHK